MNNIIDNNFNGRIYIYIDYSNIFHARYTLGWSLSVEKMINYFITYKNINHIKFYGAYDPKNLPQTKWVSKIQKLFRENDVYFYFKKLEKKMRNE